MYLSRIQLCSERLKPTMLEKWQQATSYAAHQWLWQLFPAQQKRNFLFRQEPGSRFFVLSETPPLVQHELFIIETKAFNPQLKNGESLDFQLRANPVVSRNKKRCDVMMDAKFQARASGAAPEKWWQLQTEAAYHWLERQGIKYGFELVVPSSCDFYCWAEEETPAAELTCVTAYQQNKFKRRNDQQAISYSSVDYAGMLKVVDAERFQQALYSGIGKSKALGCGMLMIKRPRL